MIHLILVLIPSTYTADLIASDDITFGEKLMTVLPSKIDVDFFHSVGGTFDYLAHTPTFVVKEISFDIGAPVSKVDTKTSLLMQNKVPWRGRGQASL